MRDGLRAYVKKFAYKNASTVDLWQCLSDASGGKPVRQMMQCWTQQTGYPVVAAAPEGGDAIRVTQAKFLATGADASDATTWMVPLRPRAGGLGEGAPEVLEGSTALVPAGGAVLKLNAGQSGFYRVSYAPPLLEALGGVFGSLPIADRVGVVSDLFALAMICNIGQLQSIRTQASRG